MLNELQFDGAPVVVTGAGSGIGRGAAQVLGELGAHVIATDLDGARAAETEKLLKDAGASCECQALDVTDRDAIAAFADAVGAKHGHVKSLINNAGFAQFGKATELSDELWQANVTLNLTSVFRMSKAFLPLLMKSPSGGTIVNTASIFAFMAFPGTPVYAATKGGVVSLTRQLAADYGKEGVRVNCVCPGATLTAAVQHDIEVGDVTMEQLQSRMLIGRIADPLEIGNAIAFLASDASSFITATALQIDGGQSLG